MKDYQIEFEYIKKLVEKKEYNSAKDNMKLLLEKLENELNEKKGTYFSFNHILEAYEYQYFKETNKINHTDINISAFYRFYGFILMNLNEIGPAITAYELALDWNPVDLDSLFQISELYKRSGDLKNTKQITFQLYNYCCTRATLAHFYRNLGFYYLESYKPQIAIPLYIYSNIFYETKQAHSELEYLEKALKKPNKNYTLKELQTILKQEQIPIGPNPDTIGIAFRVGQLEMEAGNISNAFDCFSMVYDLTYDEEAKMLLEKTKKLLK